MPTQHRWIVPERLIYIRTSGVVTLDDMLGNQQLIYGEIDEDGPTYHTITDLTEIEKFALGIPQIRELYVNTYVSKNYGWTVTVQPNSLQRFFASLASQFNQVESKQVSTFEEGLAFLVARDLNLGSVEDLLQARQRAHAAMVAELADQPSSSV